MDIVKRLLEPVIDTFFGPVIEPIKKEAADEIERLREQAHYHYENGLKKDVEIGRLREALRKIRGGLGDPFDNRLPHEIAAAYIQQKGE